MKALRINVYDTIHTGGETVYHGLAFCCVAPLYQVEDFIPHANTLHWPPLMARAPSSFLTSDLFVTAL
jgi:hypothetical protein